jgi:plasmid maintenance system antidote protein VapI
MENNELNSAEIMKNVLEELRYGARPFAKELDVTPMAIYQITGGMNKISKKLADKIIKRFPSVNYWYLIKGKLPILLENQKLITNQDNLFNVGGPNNLVPKSIDYSLETFAVLKSIDAKMDILIELMQQKKADNQ